MLRRHAGNIDYIICEGTLLSRDGPAPKSEKTLEQEAKALMETCPYVFALCSSTHIERISAFYRANPRGRFFVCDAYQKKQLDTVKKADFGEDYRFQHVYDYAPNLDRHMREKGFCMLVRQGAFFRRVMEKYQDNCLVIYAMWTGYLDERAKNPGLCDFLAPYRYRVLHTSGHAPPEDLKGLYDMVNPRYGLIPIHTDAPEKFADIVPEGKLILLKDGEILTQKESEKNAN